MTSNLLRMSSRALSKDDLESLLNEVGQILYTSGGGLEKKEIREWKNAVRELVPTRLRLPGRGAASTAKARRLEYILKEMAITCSSPSHQNSVIAGGHLKLDWSSSVIRMRIEDGSTHRLPVPTWVDTAGRPIDYNGFVWIRAQDAFVLPDPSTIPAPGTALSLEKDGYRINSRHALALGVTTYGPHRLGGQHF